MVANALVILALCLIIGFFALAEFALTFASRRRLRDRAYHGDRGARAALEFGRDPEGFVALARLIVMLAIVAAGVWLGEALASRFGPADPASGEGMAVVAAATAALAILVLFFGDLLPRSLAKSRPETLASVLGRLISWSSFLISPLIAPRRRISGLLSKWLWGRSADPEPTLEQRIKEMVFEGVESGDFDPSQSEILKRAMRFRDRRARALMTPRDKVVWLDVRDPPEEIYQKIAASPNASFPVCDGTLDNLLGMIRLADLLARGVEGGPLRFKGLLTLPAFIYEGARGPQVLEVLKQSTAQAAVALDEFGSVVGLLTLADVQEAILGPVVEKPEGDQPRPVQRPDGSWLLDGRLPIDEFFDLFHIHEAPEGDFDTLGGLVITKLGHIPRVGESFARFGLRFEVVDMDANRVHRVLVRPPGRRRRS